MMLYNTSLTADNNYSIWSI